MSTTIVLREQAHAMTAQWPQYHGKFADWEAVTCTRDVKSRGQVICAKGDTVLIQPGSAELPHPGPSRFSPKHLVGKVFASFFLPKNMDGTVTSLRVDYFEPEAATVAGEAIIPEWATTR